MGSIHPSPFPCPLVLCAGFQFALKVLVRDAVTRQPLSGVAVDIYVNHMLNGTAYTGAQAGDALLQVPYSTALSLTLLGRKDGYLPALQPWSATQRPRESKQQQQQQGNTRLSEPIGGLWKKCRETSRKPSASLKFSESDQ